MAEIGELPIEWATEARFEGRLDTTRESHLLQNGFQHRIEMRIVAGVIIGVCRRTETRAQQPVRRTPITARLNTADGRVLGIVALPVAFIRTTSSEVVMIDSL